MTYWIWTLLSETLSFLGTCRLDLVGSGSLLKAPCPWLLNQEIKHSPVLNYFSTSHRHCTVDHTEKTSHHPTVRRTCCLIRERRWAQQSVWMSCVWTTWTGTVSPSWSGPCPPRGDTAQTSHWIHSAWGEGEMQPILLIYIAFCWIQRSLLNMSVYRTGYIIK